MNIVLGIIIIFNFLPVCWLDDWCSLNCDDGENIACTHKGECAPNSPCMLTHIDKEKIVDLHNKLRSDFATGKDSRARNIEAADMMALAWDDKLAFVASCNLKACPEGIAHDKCRSTKKFKAVGQNLFMSVSSKPCRQVYNESIQKWYDEIKDMTLDQIKEGGRSYRSNHATGHFTQVVWSTTTHVGCASTTKVLTLGEMCIMACNYGPAGNMLGGRMFQEGSPATKCPEGVKAGSKYSGLCGKGYALNIPTIILFGSLSFRFVL